MADTVNVDTLEQMVRDGLLFQNARAGTALSDLAARAREAEEDAERAEAAEQEVRFLLSDPDMRQIREWIEQREARLARRVAELEAALSWALATLEIALARIDTIDGESLSDEHYAIRQAGLAKARAALAGDGGGA
jgi:hypothetical protein